MTEKTVYVIGAGASREANLPTGEELKNIIARMLDFRTSTLGRQEGGDHIIFAALKHFIRQPSGQPGNISLYLNEARHIRDALPQAISIDNFIDAQRGNEKIALCGKLAIVRSILDAEKRSLLFVDTNNANSTINFNALSKTWYIPFFQQITENCTIDDLEKRFKAITLIIFNYDRCVEHFVYYALQNYYRSNGEEAARLVRNINIYHPYGAVGKLPWFKQCNGIEFGLEPQADQLLNITSKIKTFTEGTDPSSSEIDSIREKIDQASRLVFLGFAFHKLNMQLITPKHKSGGTVVKCFASTLNISFSDQQVIEQQIKGVISPVQVKISDATCYDFFCEHWRSLAF